MERIKRNSTQKKEINTCSEFKELHNELKRLVAMYIKSAFSVLSAKPLFGVKNNPIAEKARSDLTDVHGMPVVCCNGMKEIYYRNFLSIKTTEGKINKIL